MKKIAFFSTNGGTLFSGNSVDEALRLIGFNLGNSLFHGALYNWFVGSKTLVHTGSNTKWINDNCDCLIIPAANQVNENWDLVDWANFLRKIQIPVFCIGLGAQADNTNSVIRNLKPGTRDFLDVLSDKCKTIGVRGQFTKDVLKNIGIENTEIAGCPSILYNPNVKGETIRRKLMSFKEEADPQINIALSTLEQKVLPIERKLFELSKNTNHQILLQTNELLFDLMRNGVNEKNKSHASWLAQIIRPDLSLSDFIKYFQKHSVSYSDSRSWIDLVYKTHLCIGMRIHANIAAILGGSLGICIVFDSRTEELSETMGIPFLKFDDFNNVNSLHELLDGVSFDSENFDTRWEKNYKGLLGLLP
jgi:polysaccharide pyruvyl transferase WcaK-like protein